MAVVMDGWNERSASTRELMCDARATSNSDRAADFEKVRTRTSRPSARPCLVVTSLPSARRPDGQMNSQETVLCSSGASSSSQGLGAITVHDFQTGTLLASFKQTCADVHSTAVIPTRNGEGGFMLAAQPDKSILNAYYFQKVCKFLSREASCLTH